METIFGAPCPVFPPLIGEASELKKMSQKVEKCHNFLAPLLLPPDNLEFLNLRKIGNLMTPPTWELIWENFEIKKILNFRNTPQKTKHNKLKTLKIS